MQNKNATASARLEDRTERRGYKKTTLGWISEEWSIKTLGEIGVFSKGKGINKSAIKEDGLPCVRYAEIYTKYDNYTYAFTSFIDETEAAKSKKIQNGDLLFAGSGETLEDIGKCIAYLGETPAFAGGDIIILRPKGVYSKFLGLLLNHDDTKRQTHKLGQGHSVVHIYSSGLKNLKVLLPPLPEQQKIAKILSTWDTAIATQQQLIAAKETFKKGLMQLLLTGGKRFEGFEGEWEEIKLGSLSTSFSGGTPSRAKKEYYNGNIPWIKSGDLNQENIVYVEENISEQALANSSAKIIEEGTLLLAMYGATAGVVAVTSIRGAINQAILAIKTSNSLEKMFLYFLLKLKMPHYVHRLVQGGQPNLSGGIIKKLKFSLPPILEQQKVASVLSNADKEIALLKQQLGQLQDQKRGLMQRLLTGAVRVKNMEI